MSIVSQPGIVTLAAEVVEAVMPTKWDRIRAGFLSWREAFWPGVA